MSALYGDCAPPATSAPLALAWQGRMVRVGGQPRSAVLQSVRDVGVRLNAYAETLLEHPAFDDPEGQDLRIVERTVQRLGLPAGGT